MSIITINPATGRKIQEHAGMSLYDVEDFLESTKNAFNDWKNTDVAKRANFFRQLAGKLREKQEEYATLITTEMGKPIKQSRAEIEKCAVVCEYYADNAADMLKPEIVKTEATKSYVSFQPLGIILGIMPWNFPFWQVLRFAIPTMMAGNAVFLKHALNVTGCSLAIEQLFKDAGFPTDLFRSLFIDHKQVYQLIRKVDIKGISLTGSIPAGSTVAKQAACYIKKTVLELGGNDPYLILEDADVEQAVKICVASRLVNTGQSCVAAKRFIVVKKNERKFTDLMVDHMRQIKYGDPMDESMDIGPLAREDLRQKFHWDVSSSYHQGGKLLLGGEMPEGRGYFYPPTVVTNIKQKHDTNYKELFGPAAIIMPAKDEAEAIEIANSTFYGLGAAVFTQDIARGEHIAAHELEAGFCVVNGMVTSDPRLPFGGIKDSGYGRELSHYGLKEFVNVKTVVIR